MAGEDEERFEDYLELDHYIEELRAGRIAHPPRGLTPTLASIYWMVALFRAAPAEEDQPRRAFAAALQARLQEELRHPSKTPRVPFPAGKPSDTTRTVRPTVSRRALVCDGAIAAASLVVGVGLGATIERQVRPVSGPGATTSRVSPPLVPTGKGSWVAVAKLADLGENAIRFATPTMVGYVIRSDGREGEKPGVIAVSAACTHMGCIVQWHSADRKYHCSCHGGLFTQYGQPDTTWPHLPALPRLETRITRHATGEFIEVRVPTSASTT
jgi:Rieske Fe-S protein